MGIVDQLVINLFTNFGTPIVLLSAILLIIWFIYKQLFSNSGKNPFIKASRAKQPFVYDKDKREAVLKQGFTSKKIPSDLDVIVIGSGIGGLSCAALLSKAGKKVLVLEQHDQAGGCCHTFIEKGYEFDVGIHYVGEVANNTITQTLVDQISDGQIGWAPVEDVIDQVELGVGDERSTHRILKGRDVWKGELKKDFPDEHVAIEKFFKVMKEARKSYPHSFMLKLLPLWLVNIIIQTGLLRLISNLPKFAEMSVGQFMDSITTNEKLKANLCYSFGDYGTQPREAPILMQSLLMAHYTYGGYYPIGGASEIAFHIIPVIERTGGKVLVRANVTKILVEDNKVRGVEVSKGGETYTICAPMVISAAGIINTYEKMIPKTVSCSASLSDTLGLVRNGHGAMSIFVGLEGTKEELGLKATNTWAFCEARLDKGLDDFIKLPIEDVGKTDIPLLFISFPSSKDPLWAERYPGKSNCTVVTLANFDWFKQWEDTRINKRGSEYEDLKMRLGEKAWEQTCRFYPQLKDKRRFFDVGSPLTNQYYIGSSKGEMYGIDHCVQRFSLPVAAQLRPSTPISGLYLTGQDITTCGFAGALYSGLLTSCVILKRNLMNDLVALTKEIRREVKKKSE